MAKSKGSTSRRSPKTSSRKGRNTYVTKSGQSIKLNRNLGDKLVGWKDTWKQHKAARLAGMPKTRFKRFLFRLKPSNLYHYWFSREGAIMALKLFGIGVVVLFVLIVGAFAYLRKDLPAVNSIYGQNLGGSISYYDSTGKVLLWQDYNAVKRVPVPGNQISNNLKNATVAIEDKNFYHEGAFDILAIARSGVHDVVSPGSGLYGGSTITQQLVKLNENWTDNRTILRKIKEVILASELEREYSKADILTAYLNIAPYGGVDYGAQTAAQDYFRENASQLDLAQSVFLAAIPQSPSYYSPYSPDFSQPALVGRMLYILRVMHQQGYITEAQAKQAASENVVAEIQPQTSRYNNIQAPYFLLSAKSQLQSQFGTSSVEQGGWKVITTLNMNVQNEAEQLVANNLPNVERYDGDDEALVAEDAPTGQVIAQVGGTNFNNPTYGQINFATAPINPGSSYKLYDYTALINDNDNVGAGSVLYDIQQPIPGYPCTNKAEPLQGGNCLEDYDFRYPGAESIRYAFAGSRNVPAVKAMLINGESKTISLSEQMGLTSGYLCYADTNLTVTAPCYGSAAIGDGAYLSLNQHVNGFATSARLGNYVPQTYILKVTNSAGKNVYTWTQPKPDQVVKPDASYIVDNIISDPKASYLPGSCTATNCTSLGQGGYKFQRIDGWDVGVKTGTTNANYDGLMMSITTQYAVGSWVGYHTRQRALVAGGMEYLTEPLTRGMMAYLIQGKTPQNWVAPPGIKTLPAYVQTVHVGIGSEEPGPSTDLYPSWYNPSSSTSKSVVIDKVSNKLATSCTPALAKETVGGSANANAFSVDTFVTGSGSPSTSNLSQYNTSQNDDVHLCGDSLPQISQSNSVVCNSPLPGQCTFGVTLAQGTHPLGSTSFPTQVNVIVGGATIPATCSGFDPTNPAASVNATCTFSYGGSGEQSIQYQVIDSVLYSTTSTDGTTVNIPAITSPLSGAAIRSGTNIQFQFTSPDAGTVYITGAASSNCSGTDNCTVTLSPGSYTAQVEDSTTSQYSQPVSFTVSGP